MKTISRVGGSAAALILLTLSACAGSGGSSGGGSGGGGGGSTANVPTITEQPGSLSVPAGGTASLTVAATGNGTLTYQWYVEGIACPNCNAVQGATTPTLTLTAVNAGTAGAYYCIVTNTLNGTKATATSASGTVNVFEPTGSGAIGADSAVLPNTAGYVASVAAQSGVTYTWTISNGTITAGQGTTHIAYTSGNLGLLQLTVTVSGATAGTVVGVKNLFVVSSLPIVSIFAQSAVLPNASGVLASTRPAPGGTYGWTLLNGTASATVVGSDTTDPLTYNVGATPGSYQISVDVTDAAAESSATRTLSVVQGTFLKDVRDMAQRSLHTATLLTDGHVLFAGGDAGLPDFDNNTNLPTVGANSNIIAAAELFDPVTKTWAVVSSLSTARAQHAATLLNDGRVLVAGGLDATGTALASTEIYDPTTRGWNPGPSMATARALPSATLLTDGRVLVAGGANASGVIGATEVYDPVANTWSSARTMLSPRVLHSATRLPNGEVLVVSGLTGSGPQTASTELYNPTTNSWQAAAPLPQSPTGILPQGAVLLASGKVLELGETAYIYDPASKSWQPSVNPSPMQSGNVTLGVSATTAILLLDGRVLAAGAYGPQEFGAAIYDPTMQAWSGTGSTPSNAPPWGFGGASGTVTGLQDGRVLAQGGYVGSNSLSIPALYDPTQNSWSLGGSQAYSGYYAASGVLANGQVLVTGGSVISGQGQLTALNTTALFDPTTNIWAPAAAMLTERQQHTATVLLNGNVLVTGGNYGSQYVGVSDNVFSSAELYDLSANNWRSAGTMSSPRYQHTASLLANGMVLVAGGNNRVGTCSCTTFVASADLYNPANNSFTPTGSLLTARYAHTATALPNGMVVVTGGFGGATSTLESGGAPLSSAELYNPTTGKWTATGSMTTPRMNHTATLLPSGKVLVAGGYTGTATTASAEVYDPSSGTWSAAASMSTPRQSQQAVLLSNGTALIVGGLNDSSSAVIGVATAEGYNPTANTWTLSGAMVTTRQFFVLNALNDGRILLEGGSPNASGLPEFYK